jgi:hypothetical protein
VAKVSSILAFDRSDRYMGSTTYGVELERLPPAGLPFPESFACISTEVYMSKWNLESFDDQWPQYDNEVE